MAELRTPCSRCYYSFSATIARCPRCDHPRRENPWTAGVPTEPGDYWLLVRWRPEPWPVRVLATLRTYIVVDEIRHQEANTIDKRRIRAHCPIPPTPTGWKEHIDAT